MVFNFCHYLVHDCDGINWSSIVDVVFDEMNRFLCSKTRMIHMKLKSNNEKSGNISSCFLLVKYCKLYGYDV